MGPTLAAIRALVVELRLATTDWAEMVDTVFSALNRAPLHRLDARPDGIHRCPLKVMTGITPSCPLQNVLPHPRAYAAPISLSTVRAAQCISIDTLQSTLHDIHRSIAATDTARRKKAIAAHNRDKHIFVPEFSVGDFVLVHQHVDRGHKAEFKWYGPYTVIVPDEPLVFRVGSFITHLEERAHARCLRFYHDALHNSTLSPAERRIADDREARNETIDALLDLGEDANDRLFFRICWSGLPGEAHWTWHDITTIFEDVRDLVRASLQGCPKRRLFAKPKHQLNIL